jgi:hypothetical protein
VKIRTVLSAGTASALAMSLSIVIAPLAHADTSTPGSYNTLTPTRVLDTRIGLGAPKIAVAAGATLTFVATRAIAAPVSAVTLNVTAVLPTTAGFLTVFAAGAPRALASNLNFQVGQTVPNLVVTPVGSGGRVSIYNGSNGTVDILADLHGYFLGGAATATPGTLAPMGTKRFLDTRIGLGAPKARVGGSSTVTLKVAGVNKIPVDATAVVVNVTATGGAGSGYITASSGSPLPNTSVLNYVKNQDRANLMLQQIGPDGTISLFNGSTTTVDLVADIQGYFVGGDPVTDGTFVPSTPYRIFDSRGPGGAAAGPNTMSKIRIFAADDPTFAYFKAVVLNVTAAEPTKVGYLTTWNGVGQLPRVSSNNFTTNVNNAGAVVVPVSPDGTVSIYNGSAGNTQLVVDVTGFFFAIPQSPANRTAAAAMTTKERIAHILSSLQGVHTASVPVSVTGR